jgi:hypothetical protein
LDRKRLRCPGAIIEIQNFSHVLPHRAFEDAAPRWDQGVAERRDVHDVGDSWMNNDVADVASIFKADIGPGFPASVDL